MTLTPAPTRVAMTAGRSGGTPPKGKANVVYNPGKTTRGSDVKSAMKTNDFKVLGQNTGNGDVC